MDNALGMGRIQSIGDLNGQIEQRLGSHRPAHDSVLQRHAVQKLHRDERLALMLADFENCADIRVVQTGSRACFAPETLQ